MEKGEAQEMIQEQTPSEPQFQPAFEKEVPSASSDDHSIYEPVPRLRGKAFLTVFAVCLIYFAQVMNVVGTGAHVRDIATVVGGSDIIVWFTNITNIFTMVLGPPFCQAADLWGRRWFVIVLTACGAVGCLIIARASSMPMAIGGSLVASLSYGAQPLLYAIASEVLQRRYRPVAQAAITGSSSLSGLTSLLAGGAWTSAAGPEAFRYLWYLIAALFALAAALCAVLYAPPVRPSQRGLSHAQKLARLDWAAYTLLAAGTVLFCTGLAWSQNPYPWTDAHVVAPFLVGTVLATALGVYAWRVKTDGMFHHSLFAAGPGYNFVLTLVCIFVEGIVFFAANVYFSFEMTVLYEPDSLRVGLRFGTGFISCTVISLIGGAYCSATKQIRAPAIAAFGCFLLFNICMATATPSSSAAMWGFPVILGAGFGVCQGAIVTAAQLSTPRELIATATGLTLSVRSLGGTVGLAAYNAIFNAQLASSIGDAVEPLGLPHASLLRFVTALRGNFIRAQLLAVPGVTLEIAAAGKAALPGAYAVAFRQVWIAAGSLTVVGALAAFFLVDPITEFSPHVDAPLQKEGVSAVHHQGGQ